MLNALVTLRCPNRWLLVALNDLLREAFKRRRKYFLNLNGWRYRYYKTLFGRRLIDLELSTPLRNLSSQVVAQIGQVLVRVLNCRGVRKRLRGFLESLIPNGLP